jgi:hypothetical protein
MIQLRHFRWHPLQEQWFVGVGLKLQLKIGLVLSMLFPARACTTPCKVIISPGSAHIIQGMAVKFTAFVKPSSCSQALSWTASAGSINGGLFTAPPILGVETMTAVVSAQQVEDPHAIGSATVIIRKTGKAPVKPPKVPKLPQTTVTANLPSKKT